MFASPDGAYRVLFVEARPDLNAYSACAAWLKSVQETVQGLRANQPDWAGVTIRYTGRPAFVTEIASGMQRDLSGSVAGTAVIIALLFWLAHRRWLPMLWLLALLALILLGATALGSLILGTISVVSLGFAAVLLGLAVDYAVVHYQEALSHPHLSVPEIRRAIAPSILWAAITTICAFLVLNLGGLPGLAQLGSLVALGVALAALVMVAAYLPPLFPDRRIPKTPLPSRPWWSYFIPPTGNPLAAGRPSSGRSGMEGFGEPPATGLQSLGSGRVALWITGLLAGLVAAVLCLERPKLDASPEALRPRRSEAERALEEMTAATGLPRDPLWLIVAGKDEREVYERLNRAGQTLERARSEHLIAGCLLPTALWPRAECQQANRPAARWLAAQGPALEAAALRAGFNTNALFLTQAMLQSWERAGRSTGVLWPTNQMSQWLLQQFVARADGQWLALGLVYGPTNQTDISSLATLSLELQPAHIWLSGWNLLGATTLARVRARLWLLALPMVALVLTSLWLAFRRPAELLLSLAVLLLSALCLLATMALAHWSWNLLNLMAVPLILGTGVDYGIFMQLALRRHGGDVAAVRRSIGRALLLCGGTAIAGFGSLAWSGNAGMASLGKVCAAGIAANVLISVYLLPGWWRQTRPPARPEPASNASAPPTSPSSFYRARLWRLGLLLTRVTPPPLLRLLCLSIAELDFQARRDRREVVIQNLLPALAGDRTAARKTARRLFHQMAWKMADLWQFEAGVLRHNWLNEQKDWELFESVRARGQGVLLITPHLGNWELGGALLARHGFKLLVLTQAEPDENLTRLRAASRTRWGIETLVVGSDGFAFVEIIKRLQAGEIVALLLDRPPVPKAVSVQLFGRPFPASVAAAELARASGCALLGVTIVRSNGGYTARVLPEITYDRQVLGHREARQDLTRKIMRAIRARNPQPFGPMVPFCSHLAVKARAFHGLIAGPGSRGHVAQVSKPAVSPTSSRHAVPAYEISGRAARSDFDVRPSDF